MGDAMCEDYEKAKQNRDRQAADKHEPYYWWERPDSPEEKATPARTNSSGLARSRRELKSRQGKE